MKASAVSYGAASIVAAFATGKGSSFGVSLQTKATVKLNNSGIIQPKIKNYSDESTKLVESCIEVVLERFNLSYGAVIETESTIPPARGLKSSSTVSNAVVLAALGALDKADEISPEEVINLGIDASFRANVTKTGAIDDASASFFGGYTVTDNLNRQILKRGQMDDDLRVILLVPEGKSYSAEVDMSKIQTRRDEVEKAWNLAYEGRVYEAINLNGRIHSEIFGFDPGIAEDALGAGALAAGLSGKGPAVAALTKDKTGEIRDAWRSYPGDIIEAQVNNTQAHLL